MCLNHHFQVQPNLPVIVSFYDRGILSFSKPSVLILADVRRPHFFSVKENKKRAHHQLGWQILLALLLHPLARQPLALSEHPQSEFHVLLKWHPLLTLHFPQCGET